jgi:putative nucleotidyltransferase with HDIG domain
MMPNAGVESVAEQIAGQVRTLATLPSVALRINRIVGNPRASARTLQAIVEEDPALAANIVRVANSPMFGYAGGVGSLDRAIFVLGFQAVRNIAMATSLSPLLRRHTPAAACVSEQVWRHSLATGVAATLVANAADRTIASDAFLAGLLHDIGVSAEAQFDPVGLADAVSRARTRPGSCLDIETEIFGTTHQHVGAALLSRWRFPRHLVLVAGAHHAPVHLAPADRRLPMLVYLADWLAAEAGLGFALDRPAATPLESAFLDACGLGAGQVFALVGELAAAFADVDSLMRVA